MPASAHVPRQALLAVRRHSALCSPLGAALRSVASVGVLCSHLSTRSACGQLFLEATVELSARIPPRTPCQRLSMCMITSGAPYACGCAPCVATRCSYVRHDGVTRCKLELPSGPADIPGRPASPSIPVAIITLVSSTFRSRPTIQQAHPPRHIERGCPAALQWSSASIEWRPT